MKRFDAVIVGGGPAGSTCATALRRAGMNVVLLDKASFPRDKTCAGWITPQVAATTGLDLAEYRRHATLQPLSSFVVGFGKDKPVRVRYGRVVGYGIRRCEFDHHLLSQAGVATVLGRPVESLQRTGADWIINGEIRAPLLIGAAGHFCPVAQFLGADLGRRERPIIAQEIEFEDPSPNLNETGDSVAAPGLYFCEDLMGYGWCFRKGRFVNIGFGREQSAGLARSTRDFWDWLVEIGQAPAGVHPRFHGHAYLSRAQTTRPLFSDGALLIGDSAGLADPVSGEGIRAAVESALLAARVVRASGEIYNRSRLGAYAELVREHFGIAGHRRESRVPTAIHSTLARLLMKSAWMTRRIILDRGFLHPADIPLQADSTAAGSAAGQPS